MQRFRGGLVFKTHRLYISLNAGLESNKEKEEKNRSAVLGASSYNLAQLERHSEEHRKTPAVRKEAAVQITHAYLCRSLFGLEWCAVLFFFFTLVTGPRRSLSLKLSDTSLEWCAVRCQTARTCVA